MRDSTPACPVMTRDWAMCRYLAHEHGIVGIPPSAFYAADTKDEAANFVRFAICKTDESLAEAAKRMKAMGEKLGR